MLLVSLLRWLLWLSSLWLLLFPVSLGVSLTVCHDCPVAGSLAARPTTCCYNELPIKTRWWDGDTLVDDWRPARGDQGRSACWMSVWTEVSVPVSAAR